VACEIDGLAGGSGLPSTAWSLCWIAALAVAVEIDGLVAGSSEESRSIVALGEVLDSELEGEWNASKNRGMVRLRLLLFEDILERRVCICE
jgi:hypothetical protein